MGKGVLSNLKVLELASVLAGPSVGQFFAELGAEVIKVENIKSGGDVTRSWVSEEEEVQNQGVSAYFSSVNWGKKSLVVDLMSQEGQAIVHQLISQTDIVIASFKAGDDKKLRVDYDTLKKLNQSLIYAHITGYGPENKKTGYDAVIQAEAGFMYMNGEPGGESLKMPVALIDILAAHHLKEGILLALLKRSSTRTGEYVHVSLYDAAISSLANQSANWLVAKKIPGKMGQEHPNIAPYGRAFVSNDDKHILLAVGTDVQFQKLCNILNLTDLASDPSFLTNENRVKNRENLNKALSSAIQEFEADDLVEKLNSNAIPCGLINTMDDVFQSKESEVMILKPQESASTMVGVRNIAFSLGQHRPDGRLNSPPLLGQHTHEILSGSLDYSDAEILKLLKSGVIAS